MTAIRHAGIVAGCILLLAAPLRADEQALNHHLVRSAKLESGQGEDNIVPLMPWRKTDDTIEGWDWSLPPGVKPIPSSGLIFGREKRTFPGNKLGDISVFWRDVEPEEGQYDFSSVRKKLASLPKDVIGCRFHFYATVAYRVRNGQKQLLGPKWMQKYARQIPLIDMTSVEGRFQLFNYAIWKGEYHRRYLRAIEAFGRSGIPKNKALRIVYVGAISKSWGEEMYIPRTVGLWCEKNAGLTPQRLEKCLTERLDAWGKAFKGREGILAWVGAGNSGVSGKGDFSQVGRRVIKHAYDLGMGQRCGFVENYLYHLHNPAIGQSTDARGYLHVDETCPPIAQGRAFGDENEEYGKYWVGRFGPLSTHAYRYHESMIRTLQMRRNYLWMSGSSVDMDPPLTAYMSLALGRKATDSPDAFCYLRQSIVRGSAAGKKSKEFAIKNFERWLIQRDRDGYRTKAAVKVPQHKSMWMVPKNYKFDYIARRTDLASNNSKIGFALDDRFLSGGAHSVAIKVTYHDIGSGKWTLVYTKHGGATARRTIQCKNTKKALTATFHLTDASFGAKGDALDFHIQAAGEDATISFVRVIKT
ncbi:MAG: hypothetical protein ISS69_02255 [Phycisphaerae bacterium]|nr:hypothetical protein [Phycisphaerae bacterium]